MDRLSNITQVAVRYDCISARCDSAVGNHIIIVIIIVSLHLQYSAQIHYNVMFLCHGMYFKSFLGDN